MACIRMEHELKVTGCIMFRSMFNTHSHPGMYDHPLNRRSTAPCIFYWFDITAQERVMSSPDAKLDR